ncbi:hypothetical protein F0251_07580 [Vibrio sp. 070316B]|nr:hypothetical protein [Vibrio sp. 070316B]NOI85945.1 hypothetical protein [Vibrio sp. 99K-1]NOI94818.1 hypothetical protein [Vibrio sp. T3Y01]
MKESYKTERFINVPLMNRVICFHKLTFTYLLEVLLIKESAELLILIELFHFYPSSAKHLQCNNHKIIVTYSTCSMLLLALSGFVVNDTSSFTKVVFLVRH